MRRICTAVAILTGCLLGSQALAADLGSKGTRFGLEMHRYEAALQYDQAVYRTHIEGFLVFFTEPLSASMDLGMDLGRVFMIQDDNPDSSDAAPGGYLIGIWWQYNWTPLANFGLHGRVGVRHHNAGDASDPDRKVSFEWQEYDARLLTSLRFGSLELVAGGLIQDLRGTHRNKGLSSASWSFTTDPGLELQLQLNFIVDDRGRAGVRYERQADDGDHHRFSLVFETRY